MTESELIGKWKEVLPAFSLVKFRDSDTPFVSEYIDICRRMYNDGTIDSNWMSAALDFVAFGYFMFPTTRTGATQAEVDYINAILDKTGLRKFKDRYLRATMEYDAELAQKYAKKGELYDTIYSAANYISGNKFLEKADEYVRNIALEIKRINGILTAAREQLPPEKYREIEYAMRPAKESLDYLEKIFPGISQETGGIGITSAAVYAIGAASIGILAVTYNAISYYRHKGETMLQQMAANIIQQRIDALNEERRARISSAKSNEEIAAINYEYNNKIKDVQESAARLIKAMPGSQYDWVKSAGTILIVLIGVGIGAMVISKLKQ